MPVAQKADYYNRKPMMGTINDKAPDKRSLITNHSGIHERK